MKKREVKLNESQLRKVVSESVKNILKEYYTDYEVKRTPDEETQYGIWTLSCNVNYVKNRIAKIQKEKGDDESIQKALYCIGKLEIALENYGINESVDEYFVDYGDPVDTRSAQERVNSEMQYLRNRVNSELENLNTRYGAQGAKVTAYAKKAYTILKNFSRILGKYGF